MNKNNKSKDQLILENQQLRFDLADAKQSAENRSAELYKNEERFSLAMQGANDGLWDWNLETDEVYYSPRWKSMLGYKENELDNLLSTWASLVNSNDKDWVLQKVDDYITGQSSSFEVEMRMQHKEGHDIFVLSRAFVVYHASDAKPIRLVGTHVDITERKKAESFAENNAQILEMIAIGKPASAIYDAIAIMYEARHPGMRCSMLELHGNKLMHGGAPSLPKAYCEAVHGLEYGPDIGSCGTSTYTGKRVIVEDIETDPKWANIKHIALPHGMRCCWSEPIKNSSGKVLGAFGMYYNHPARPNKEESNDLKSAAWLAGIIMEREQDQKQIRELAYTDELTGLASRAFFFLNLEKLIKQSDRHHRLFSLLYIDLDNFKDINDSLGHDVGDRLLKEVAKRLTNASREVDFVARLGGDEFCILVEDVVDANTASNVAQRCLNLVSQPFQLSNRKLIPGCSIGIAHYPKDGENIPSLIKAADTSLYAAKDCGRNCYTSYKPEFTEKAEYRFLVENHLREAIENQQITLVYQPQIDVTTGEIIGVEALSRWNHAHLGHISPVDFIPTAERIGMIKPLTEWVLNTACKQSIEWQKAGFPALKIAVNISPSHFLDNDIVSLIKHVLNETGIAPSELRLEVTEGAIQTNEKNLSIFQELKELGILLAIDDFGTGYSSFASLKHLKVDSLKIDKYFIDDMLNDKKTLLLISSMIEMGHSLKYEIIAEGVETLKQFNALKKLGCETVQGYLFSKPVSANEISKLLNTAFVI